MQQQAITPEIIEPVAALAQCGVGAVMIATGAMGRSLAHRFLIDAPRGFVSANYASSAALLAGAIMLGIGIVNILIIEGAR
jgi:hypothetical protein